MSPEESFLATDWLQEGQRSMGMPVNGRKKRSVVQALVRGIVSAGSTLSDEARMEERQVLVNGRREFLEDDHDERRGNNGEKEATWLERTWFNFLRMGEGLEEYPPSFFEGLVMRAGTFVLERSPLAPKVPNRGFVDELEESVSLALGREEEAEIPMRQRLVRRFLLEEGGELTEEEWAIRENLDAYARPEDRINVVVNSIVNRARDNVRALRAISAGADDGWFFVGPKINVKERRVNLFQTAVAGAEFRIEGFKVQDGNIVAIKPGRTGDDVPISLLALGGERPEVTMMPGDPAWADILRKGVRLIKKDYKPPVSRVYFVPTGQISDWKAGQGGQEVVFIVVDDARNTIKGIRRVADDLVDFVWGKKAEIGPPIRLKNLLPVPEEQKIAQKRIVSAIEQDKVRAKKRMGKNGDVGGGGKITSSIAKKRSGFFKKLFDGAGSAEDGIFIRLIREKKLQKRKKKSGLIEIERGLFELGTSFEKWKNRGEMAWREAMSRGEIDLSTNEPKVGSHAHGTYSHARRRAQEAQKNIRRLKSELN